MPWRPWIRLGCAALALAWTIGAGNPRAALRAEDAAGASAAPSAHADGADPGATEGKVDEPPRRSRREEPVGEPRERAALQGEMPHFAITERYFGKSARAEFYRKAVGGKEMRQFYEKRRNARDPERPVDRAAPESDPALRDEHGNPTAYVVIPAAFHAERGEGWGVFLHFNPTDPEKRPYRSRMLRETCATNKLVFASVNINVNAPVRDGVVGDGRPSDAAWAILTLDLLATLRAEFPALRESGSKERVFAGAVYSGYDFPSVAAGVLALNFSQEIKGYLAMHDLVIPCGIKSRAGTFMFRIDTPYLTEKDLKRLSKRLRIVGLVRYGVGYYEHQHTLYTLREFRRMGFPVRFLGATRQETSLTDAEEREAFDQALRFLGGDDAVPQPPVFSKPYYMWKWEDK